MDNRQKELLIRAKNEKATKLMRRIEKFYASKKEQPDLQELIRIPSIMLYFQNRPIVRMFLEDSRKVEVEKAIAEQKTNFDMINTKFDRYSKLMDEIDLSLKEINPDDNPIDEMFLILSLIRMAVNWIITNPPKISTNIGG